MLLRFRPREKPRNQGREEWVCGRWHHEAEICKPQSLCVSCFGKPCKAGTQLLLTYPRGLRLLTLGLVPRPAGHPLLCRNRSEQVLVERVRGCRRSSVHRPGLASNYLAHKK